VVPPTLIPVVVVGCIHQAQLPETGSAYSSAQRQFRDLLQSLIVKQDIRFIGEEATFLEEATSQKVTIARQLADHHELRYRNIDIGFNCKKEIRHRLPKEFNDETQEIEDLLVSDPYAKAWNLVREYHMYATALEELQHYPEPSVLIVGALHAAPLTTLLPSWVTVSRVDFEAA
jgi:hypothetical protein